MRAALVRLAVIVAVAIPCGALVSSVLLSEPRIAESATSIPITGYAWSDTVGWISLNCATGGSGGSNICASKNYNLSIDSDTGVVSGYAWSDNIGWISANSADIAACQSGATSIITNGAWTGWLRALAGNTGQSGGWDGCISMSGASPAYGVTVGASGNFNGCSSGGSCAWGSTVVGWVDFSNASTAFGSCQSTQGNFCKNATDVWHRDASCNETFVSTCAYQCSAGACVPPPQAIPGFPDGDALHITPNLIQQGATVLLAWDIDDVTSCSLTGSDGENIPVSVTSNSASGSQNSAALNKQTVFTLSCTGLDGNTYSESHTVNLIPGFREI